MAGWKKYFKTANVPGTASPISGGSTMPSPGYRNFASTLPEVYIGHPNRIERYNQYEQMDMDSEVNAALDILAEFCSQKNEENLTAFDIHFHEKPTDNEVKIIKEQLQQWVNLNEMNKRIFKIVRNTIKYGDQMYIRDPETFELSISPVINHFIRPILDNEMGYKITMENGREIMATGNHKFMTNNGWEEVRHMISISQIEAIQNQNNIMELEPTRIGMFMDIPGDINNIYQNHNRIIT